MGSEARGKHKVADRMRSNPLDNEEPTDGTQIRDINQAYDRISSMAKSFHRNVELPMIDEIMADAKYSFYDLFSIATRSLTCDVY